MSLTNLTKPVMNWSGTSVAIMDGANWNAIFNPVIFTYERRDFTVSSIITSPDFAGKIRVTPSASMAGLAVGDEVYISSGVYEGLAEVLQVNGGGSSFDADMIYISNTATGFVNSDTVRVNWYAQFEIYRVLPNLPLRLIGTWVQKAGSDGALMVNVSGWLKTECGFTNDFEYDKINERDDNLGGEYWLYYRERYDDQGELPAFSVINDSYYVNAARQIGDEDGANMEDFQIEGYQAEKKFLSDFEQPTYFPGYPFDLSFIMPDLAGSPPTFELSRYEDHFDINGDVVSFDGGTDMIEFGNEKAVNRLMIQQGYGPTVRSIDVWLEGAGG